MWTFDREVERNQDLSNRWIVRIQLRDNATGRTEGRHLQFAGSPTSQHVAALGAELADQMNVIEPQPETVTVLNEDGTTTVI